MTLRYKAGLSCLVVSLQWHACPTAHYPTRKACGACYYAARVRRSLAEAAR